MSSSPKIHSQITITSGCICYGALHNIWHGASSPVQDFPAAIERRLGGTIKSQILEHNTRAENGTWNVYQLAKKQDEHVCGWFACHLSINPEQEIKRVLGVSGSPYEADSGSSMNDEHTAKHGVLVINRYDWSHYDKRCEDDVKVSVTPHDNMQDFDVYEAAGLVDYHNAKDAMRTWQERKSSEREVLPGGVWMHMPQAEYMFGRFGFDEDRTAARSFLLFSTHTDFRLTTFVDQDQTLRIPETAEQRFQRQLREGYDFEGVENLKQRRTSWTPTLSIPKDGKLLGPYDSREHLLQSSGIDAIRVRPGVSAVEFAEQLKDSCHTLLNEMIMSYLEHVIAPAAASETVLAAATALFPEYGNSMSIDGCMYSFMTQPYTDNIPGYDTKAIGKKVKSFLTPRCDDRSLARDDDFAAGVCACIAYLLSEVLELANNHARDSRRSQLVPEDIRLTVFFDEELRDMFLFSKVFWKGKD